jgi:hypothetical protein
MKPKKRTVISVYSAYWYAATRIAVWIHRWMSPSSAYISMSLFHGLTE